MRNSLIIKLRIFLLPLSILVFLLILTLVEGRVLTKQIRTLKNKIDQNNKERLVLEEKIFSLQSTGAEILDESDKLLVALPHKASPLMVISQLKVVSQKNGLSLNNVKFADSGDKSGKIGQTLVSFQVNGPLESILALLRSLYYIAPLTNIVKLRINEVDNQYMAQVDTLSYWSPLPEVLPMLGEGTLKLKSEEENLLVDLYDLSLPPFVEFFPTSLVERPNPFSF